MALLTDNLIFIHIYKTGGNSLRQLLPKGEEIGSPHASVKQVQGLLAKRKDTKPRRWITIVRNPYEWNCSLYNYIRVSQGHQFYDMCNRVTFVEWLTYLTETLLKKPYVEVGDMYLTQTGFMEGSDSYLFIKQDRFNQDVHEVLNLSENTKIPTLNKRGDKLKYKQWLTPEAIAIINEHFKDDFNNFGYEMIKN